MLGSKPTGPVMARVLEPAEVSVDPKELAFTPADWSIAQAVEVTGSQDSDSRADPPVVLLHEVSGGDYDGTTASVRVTVVEDDAATLAVSGGRTAEGAGRMRFAVTLSAAASAEVTVEYATRAAGDTATAGVDYAPAQGIVTFAAGSTATQTIDVTVYDDTIDEPDEQVTVTLRNARNALLAGGGDTASAMGTIEDDDDPPRVSIGDSSLTEGAAGGAMRFAVTLERASSRTVTVRYDTADVTAAAGADYTRASGTLTFDPGERTRTIAVAVTDDALDEPDEELTVTLSAAVHARKDRDGRTDGDRHDPRQRRPPLAEHRRQQRGRGRRDHAVHGEAGSGERPAGNRLLRDRGWHGEDAPGIGLHEDRRRVDLPSRRSARADHLRADSTGRRGRGRPGDLHHEAGRSGERDAGRCHGHRLHHGRRRCSLRRSWQYARDRDLHNAGISHLRPARDRDRRRLLQGYPDLRQHPDRSHGPGEGRGRRSRLHGRYHRTNRRLGLLLVEQRQLRLSGGRPRPASFRGNLRPGVGRIGDALRRRRLVDRSERVRHVVRHRAALSRHGADRHAEERDPCRRRRLGKRDHQRPATPCHRQLDVGVRRRRSVHVRGLRRRHPDRHQTGTSRRAFRDPGLGRTLL